MQLISKISKGSRMDQIYIPKRRMGFGIGSYVVIKPLQKIEEKVSKPFFYNIDFLEPIKLRIVKEMFDVIDNNSPEYDNIIITGSFLEKGFFFNDIDILIIAETQFNKKYLEELLENKIGIKTHVILINNRILIKGLSLDPLYQMMFSKCVSRKRFVYRVKNKINYKILDLHLLKSKLLIDNFDFLNGNEKYEMVRNAVSIALFTDNKKVNKDNVDEHIDKLFGKEMSKKIKENIVIDKKEFITKYKKFYNDLSIKILNSIKNGSKQK